METMSVFSKTYWKEAAKCFRSTKKLVFAALICALRIAVKAFSIPLIPGTLYLSFDSYVNALGSFVYGPLVGLAVGAVSDTIGAILFPKGAYFFPFIIVEMSSSFIFGFFLWKKKLGTGRVIGAKFTVNILSNIVLNSLLIKWSYSYFAIDKTYNLFNGARIVKNLVVAPLESVFIVLILGACIPVLRQIGFVERDSEGLKYGKKEVLLTVFWTLFAVGIVLFWFFFLKDFLAAHNIKFW